MVYDKFFATKTLDLVKQLHVDYREHEDISDTLSRNTGAPTEIPLVIKWKVGVEKCKGEKICSPNSCAKI